MSGQSTSSCQATSTACNAVCVCDVGYGRADCSMTMSDIASELLVRSAFLDAVVTASTVNQSVSFVARSSSTLTVIAALIRDGTDLDGSTAAAVQQWLSTVTAESAAGAVSGSELSAIVNAQSMRIADLLVSSVFSAEPASLDQVSTALASVLSLSSLMVTAQDELTASTVLGNVRSTTEKNVAGNQSVTVPLTAFEQSLGWTPNRVQLSGLASNVSLNNDAFVQVLQVDHGVWTCAATQANATASMLSSSLLASNVSSASLSSHIMSVRLDNETMSKAAVLLTVNLLDVAAWSAAMNASTVTVTCAVDDVSNHSVSCPGVAPITIRCRGLEETRRIECLPPALTCSLLDFGQMTVSSIDLCELVDLTDSTATCWCDFSDSAKARRRLSSSSDKVMEAVKVSGAFNMALMSVYVGENFKDTVLASGQMSFADAFTKSYIVVAMFGMVWGLGGLVLVMMTMNLKWTARSQGKQQQQQQQQQQCKMGDPLLGTSGLSDPAQIQNLVRPRKRGQISFVHPVAGTGSAAGKVQSDRVETVSSDQMVQKLTAYIKAIVPPVFSMRPSMLRIGDELMRHHAYLNVFLGSGKKGSSARVPMLGMAQLLTVQSMLMFLLALLYDLQVPSDDGSCVSLDNEAACLHRKSPMDYRQTYCAWKGSSTCVYQQPNMQFMVVFLCAIIISVVTSVFTRPLEWMFDILAAPTKDSVRASLVAAAAVREIGKRVSVVARRASAIAVQVMQNTKQGLGLSVAADKEILQTRFIPETTHAAHKQARMMLTTFMQSELDKSKAKTHRGAVVGDSSHQEGKEQDDGHVEALFAKVVANHREKRAIDGGRSMAWLANNVSSSTTSGKETVTMQTLVAHMIEQREVLTREERRRFDAEWLWDARSNSFAEVFSVDSSSSSSWLGGSGGQHTLVASAVAREMEVAQQRSHYVSKHRLDGALEEHIGLEIMQLFVMDVLGRDSNAARIFQAKAEEDFKVIPVVSMRMKAMAVCLLVVMNVFFMYYTVVKGATKGLQWQRTFLMSFIMQLVIEVLLFETVETLWINYFVPSLINRDVVRIHATLSEAVYHLCHILSTHGRDVASRIILNAPDYLFVSTQIAKLHPQLMESMIVLSYRTYLPGELAMKWLPSSQHHMHGVHVMDFDDDDGDDDIDSSCSENDEDKEENESDESIEGAVTKKNTSVQRNNHPKSNHGSASDQRRRRQEQFHRHKRSPATVVGSATSCLRNILYGLSFLLMNLVASTPFEVQKAALRFVQPLTIGGVAYMWYRVVRHPLYLFLTALGFVLVIAFFLRRWYLEYQLLLERREKEKLAPIIVQSLIQKHYMNHDRRRLVASQSSGGHHGNQFVNHDDDKVMSLLNDAEEGDDEVDSDLVSYYGNELVDDESFDVSSVESEMDLVLSLSARSCVEDNKDSDCLSLEKKCQFGEGLVTVTSCNGSDANSEMYSSVSISTYGQL
jgi:hypothetical protein